MLVDPTTFGGRQRPADSLAALMQAGGMMTYTVKNGDDIGKVLSGRQRQSGYFVRP